MKSNAAWRRTMALAGVAAVGLMVAAPSRAEETPQEKANEAAVRNFYAALDAADAAHAMAARARAIAEQYLDPNYLSHSASAARQEVGREAFIKNMQSQPAGGGPRSPATLIAIMAKDDEVIQVTSRSMPGGGGASYIFNLYRLKNGKMIEHWDAGLGGGPPGGAGAGGPGGGFPVGGAGGPPGGAGGPPGGAPGQ